MKLWQPDRRQWRVIWSVYVISFLFSVDWDALELGYSPIESRPFVLVTFVVIAGALIVWRMQTNREKQK